MTSDTPIEITTSFLDALAGADLDGALLRIDDDIVYTNVSLPTVRGKRPFAKIFGALRRGHIDFNYRLINASADGPVVLTERIDEIRIGRVAIQFWVCGRFEIAEGRIAVWRDYFDYFDITKALLRGAVAAAVPSVQRPLPARAGAQT